MNRTQEVINDWLSKRFEVGEKILVTEKGEKIGTYEVKELGEWLMLRGPVSCAIYYDSYYVLWCLINGDFEYKREKANNE